MSELALAGRKSLNDQKNAFLSAIARHQYRTPKNKYTMPAESRAKMIFSTFEANRRRDLPRLPAGPLECAELVQHQRFPEE